MIESVLSVREIQQDDIDLIIQYWLTADHTFLRNMGVDVAQLPTKEVFIKMLSTQIKTPLQHKKSYCIIWEADGQPVGHSNTNPTVYGEEAYMHLHLWNSDIRAKGLGAEFVRMTLPYYFINLKLKRLFSEPYALNEAPNKTLEKVGFEFVKKYVTTPGSLNFEQPVKRWQLTYNKFKELL